jgi:hypothetical protein
LAVQFSEWVSSAVELALTMTNLTTGQTIEAADLAYRFDAATNVGTGIEVGTSVSSIPRLAISAKETSP